MDSMHPQQTSLITPQAEREAYERLLALRLQQIRAWSELPTERTDWALEQLLEELANAALAIRRLRTDAELPF